MKVFYFTILLLFYTSTTNAQVVNTAMIDTSEFAHQGKLVMEGYVDTYYAYNYNKPQGNQPYLVSMARHNEFSVNLAFIGVKYSSPRVRARLLPGFGTYMNSNYKDEPGTLKNIIEASAGIKLFTKKNIWLDAGVLGSPYTNESVISKDHLAYTRSLAAEYTPYYLSGIKVSVPFTKKLNVYLYLLNGWQQIQDHNNNKSVGTQLEYRPNNNLLLNWNTYLGNERSAGDSTVGTRLFSDVYFIYKNKKISATGCLYAGFQEQSADNGFWWQANLTIAYELFSKLSISGRWEYFNDRDQVLIAPITDAAYFTCHGSSIGFNFQPVENIFIRCEGRGLFSRQNIFYRGNELSNTSYTITSSIAIWF